MTLHNALPLSPGGRRRASVCTSVSNERRWGNVMVNRWGEEESASHALGQRLRTCTTSGWAGGCDSSCETNSPRKPNMAPNISPPAAATRSRCSTICSACRGDLFTLGYINRRLGLGPEKHFQTPPQLLDTARKSTCVTSDSGIRCRQRQIVLRRKRTEARLDCLFRDQNVDLHRLFLAHTVCSADALFEHRRVPGRIDVDDRVGRLKIQYRSAGVRGDEQPAPRVVLETVDDSLTFLLRHRSVQWHKVQLALSQQRLDEVKRGGPLGKQQKPPIQRSK